MIHQTSTQSSHPFVIFCVGDLAEVQGFFQDHDWRIKYVPRKEIELSVGEVYATTLTPLGTVMRHSQLPAYLNQWLKSKGDSIARIRRLSVANSVYADRIVFCPRVSYNEPEKLWVYTRSNPALPGMSTGENHEVD